jgi:hypothetical protein
MPHRIASIIRKQTGYLILGMTGTFYAIQLINESSSKVLTLGLSAFGILGILSAICFTLVPCLDKDDEKEYPLFAGEKFLHSCLFIIQSIFVKYASEQIIALQFLKNIPLLLIAINLIINTILIIVISYATYFSFFGFEALNEFLWNRCEKRLEERTSKKK